VRKRLICAQMIGLLLLSSCAGGGGISEAEELALTIRGEYLEMTQWSGKAAITADYGRRVYQYELTAGGTREETVLVLTAPETVSGITARLTQEEGFLEYDGLSVETGALDEEGLTPVSSIPVLLEAAQSGYMTACLLEEEDTVLRMECGDPEGAADTGRVVTLWFDASTHALLRGEVSVDGFRAILCQWTEFVKN